MALIVADRVQELTTTSGTGTLTLNGAVNGFQTFSNGIGNTNTTFYTIYDPTTYDWEVGIGTVGSGTLSRDTVLANSAGTTAKINLAGNQASVFCTYPADKSVNLDASGNVTPLGTISSGTWQGSTVGVAYGGTGVTASSGANSVVLRDSNQNIAVNKVSQSVNNITATGGTTTLTASSAFWQTLQGTGSHTIQLPDATTLPIGFWYIFDNDATGTLTIQDNASSSLDVIPAGGYSLFYLDDNATIAGGWNRAGLIPSEVNWGTNNLDLGGSTVVSNGTWQGTAIGTAYGGTGLTTFTAANYALYSTSASALTAGTLPVVAGGTGQTTYTDGQLLIGNSSGNTLTKSTLTAGSGISITNGNGSISIAATGGGDVTGPASSTDNAIARFDGTTGKSIQNSAVTIDDTTGSMTFTGTAARLRGDSSAAAIADRFAFQSPTTNGNSNFNVLPNGTSTIASVQLYNNSDPTNASYLNLQAGLTAHTIFSGIRGTGSYLPIVIQTSGTERLRITNNGGFAIGGSANYGTSGQVLTSNGDAPPTWTTISASGDVTGPTSSTDNAIARFDGTTGKVIQNSAVTIADTTGDITFTSLNPKLIANGLTCQSPNTNTSTYFRVVPNGTGAVGGIQVYGPGGGTYGGIGTTSTEMQLFTDSSLPMTFFVGAERLRITATGGIAFNGATNYGTSGQLLQSNGDAPPTWVNAVTASSTTTFTNKTINGAILNDGYTEEVFAVTDAAGVALSPTNGSIQTWTLGASRTPTSGTWNAGQSMTLMIDDGSAFTVTWTTLNVIWETDSGSAPTLATTGFTVIVLWKVGTQIYGARVGNA